MGSTIATGWVREPAVAGLFYPADPGRLRSEVTEHVRAAVPPADLAPPKAVIAPHAGYRYSGPTAGAAYRALAPWRGRVQRVVLAGPAHRVPVAGVGVSTAEAWRTPLGDTAVDVPACRELVERGDAVEADDAHGPEHSLEVHLPFIHEVLGPVTIVPLVVGRGSAETTGRVLERVWGGDETVVVVSSDLSHYLDDATARQRDRRTAAAILEGRSEDVGPYDACGCVPISGLLVAARDHGVVARMLAASTSADTSGDVDRVVGYGSFGFVAPRPLDDGERQWLSDLARRVIEHELTTGEPCSLDDDEVPERLRPPGCSFVSLHVDGEPAGCIGSLQPQRALWRDVAHNSRSAALDDPRYPPVQPDELAAASLTISVLSPLSPMTGDRDDILRSLRPGVDGVVLTTTQGLWGTFLPSVWGKVDDADGFLDLLLRKANLADGCWPDDAQIWRYTTDEWSDHSR
jgi:AmmeMemoRadiSam system protein B/AmmeMemoRadiSam system protein A